MTQPPLIIENNEGRQAKEKLFQIIKEITLLTGPVVEKNPHVDHQNYKKLTYPGYPGPGSTHQRSKTNHRQTLGKLTYEESKLIKQNVRKPNKSLNQHPMDMCEIKLLLSAKDLGLILGSKAENANRLREKYNIDTTCYKDFCPGSMERVVSISGTTENVLRSFQEDILEMFLCANRLTSDGGKEFREYNWG